MRAGASELGDISIGEPEFEYIFVEDECDCTS